MIIGDPREDDMIENTLGHEIVLEKIEDGQENIKLTIKSSRPGRASKSSHSPTGKQKEGANVVVQGIKQQKIVRMISQTRLIKVDQGPPISYHYYTKFNQGGQKGLTEAGKPTASVERSWLIVALIKAVGRPPRLIK